MDFESWWEPTERCIGDDTAMVFEPIAKCAWQASRNNQQELNLSEYCRFVECRYFKNETCLEPLVCPDISPHGCPFTAKGLHHWLKENGYRIVKD
jgi:hypothetical protein